MSTGFKALQFAAVFALSLVSCPAFAEDAKLSAKGEDTIKENLTRYQGKMVTLQLDSGNEISGSVVEVGDEAVHLKELVGKEYFDGLIVLDDIAAVIVRVK